MGQGRFPEGTFLLLIGTAYIVAASVFPGGLIELAFLTASGNCPPGDPGTGSPFH